MGIKTNVKVGGTKKKTFGPGNHTARILKVELVKPAYAGDKKMYHLQMMLESKPIEGDFEGFLINKDDPSKGRFKGQICTIKHNTFAFESKTITTKDGREIKIDMTDEIVKFLVILCGECKSDFMQTIDGKYDTIEDVVKAFNKARPFKDIWFEFCIAGEEYYKEQYIEYRCMLPKYEKGFKLFKNVDGEGTVLTYNESKHLKKAEAPAEVQTFDNAEEDDVDEGVDFSTEDVEEIDFDNVEDDDFPFEVDED